ncbi:hypothetical protein BerOc1_00868 [Pseudodesulfovibrio hydrargyri]|uniref:Uncharacterized protein n=1 Tax=Pseudodesulfovibrio hydrargyri TaxID=2125990 RepID=A0A1J5NC44_9BACT|nr:hypothetical protein [Pseudodesulfovibrio hydrargyri]OIQ52392.1 hypothetical protein BerOc1_00868 [Pseudodesulfovibrio hydrargyri]
MNKVTPLILTFTLTLMAGSLALAMDDDLRPEYVAMRQDVLAMDNSMRGMEQAVKGLEDPSQCQEALKELNGHMTEMRRHMLKVEAYAEQSGDMTLTASLHQLDKAMTATMQGMGQCLRDRDTAIPLVRDGVTRMRTALDVIRTDT